MKNYIMKKMLLLTSLVGLAVIVKSNSCPDGVSVVINTLTNGSASGCNSVSLTAAGSGGHGPYSYGWSGGNSTGTAGNTFTSIGTNTYTVTVTDDSSCTATATASVTVNANPSARISGPSGANGCSPVSITASGAGTGGSYAWSGGNSPSSAINGVTSTGSYTVTVTTSAGCSATSSINETVLYTPSALITPGGTSPSFCSGSSLQLTAPSNGNALTFSNGYVSATGYNVDSNNFTVEAWIYPTATGKGVIVAEGGINCAAGFVFEYSNDSLILQTATSSGCQGTVAGAGLVLNQWQHVAASVIRGTTGNLTVLYLDGNSIATGNIPNGNLNSSSLTIGGSSTSGYNFTGSIDEVRIWNTALSQSVLEGSEYSIIPSNSPSLVTYYRFDEGTGTTTADTAGHVSGTLHGTFSWQTPSTSPVYENGGQTLLYNWSSGATSQDIEVTSAGSYVVLVTSLSTSCSATDTINISVNTTPTASIDSVSPQCPGSIFTLTASGGSSYSWSGPDSFTSVQQSPSVSNATQLKAGEYIVTVSSSQGCTATAYVNVVVHVAPVGTAENNGPLCTGSSLTLTAQGGVSYVWSGPNSFSSDSADSTISSVTSSQAGTYNVTVTDANGCTASASTSVTVNAAPTATASITGSPVCAGGTFHLTASGGANYTWSGPNNFSSVSDTDSVSVASTAATGSYIVTVTDNNGCTAIDSASATVNAPPTATASSNSPVCIGTTISLTATGGVTYAWSSTTGFTASHADTSFVSTNSSTGTYTVTVTDGNGCTATASTIISVNNPPSAPSASNTGPVCEGFAATLNVSTASSYSWSGPGGFSSTQQNPTINSPLPADSGVYTVTVTESGCTATASTDLTVYPTPAATATNSTVGTQCAGENIYLAASGGASYAWSGPLGYRRSQQLDTIISANAAASGTYTVTVTDGNGCTASASTSITVIDVPAVAITTINNTICAGDTLHLTADGSQATAYSWSGPNGFTAAQQDTFIAHTSGAVAGVYTVVVTDSGGCSATASVDISVNSIPVITSCPGNLSVSASTGLCSTVVTYNVTASGTPAPGIWYSQNPGTVFSVGTTQVLVNANNTCGSSTCSFNVTVVDNQPPSITCPPNVTVLATESTGTKVLTIAPPVVSDNCGVASVVNNFNGTGNASGTYPTGTTNVVWTVTDVNGNTSTCTQVITILPRLVVSGTASNTLCPGTFFGSVTTVTGGGQTPYSYAWSNGSSTANIANLAAGTYTVTVSDAAGNTVTESFTVSTVIPVSAPAAPAAISGPAAVCAGATATYSIAAVPNSVSYIWSVGPGPNGPTILSGQGTTQVTVKFGSPNANGNLQVAAVNCVGTSPNTNLNITTINAPGNPGPITGSNSVCGAGAIYQYSIGNPPPNSGPLTYSWVAPANATIVSGQGTSAVSVKFNTGFSSGTLSVWGSNCAGNSLASTLNIAVSSALPGALNDIDLFSAANDGDGGEPTGVCPGDTVSYTVDNNNPQPNVASYNWVAPANAVVIAGQGTQVVTIVYEAGFTGGTISVSGSNCHGSGGAATQSIALNTQAPGAPQAPTAVGTPPPPSANTGCPGDTLRYYINPVSTADEYTWTVPANTMLLSGQGTTSVSFLILPAFNGGNLSVYASNCAGNSNSSFQFIDIPNPPGQPGNIQGPSAVCTGIVYNYTIAPPPPPPGGGEVESYVWTAPANAVVVSGQGTTSVSVLYQGGFSGGTLSVAATNCVEAVSSSLSVSPQSTVPGGPQPINGTMNQCIGDTGSYTVNWVNGATGYTWSAPANTSILSGQGSTTVVLTFNTGYTGGTLTVVPSNCVGSGAAQTARLTHNNCGTHGTTGIEDESGLSGLDVQAYPNPFNGQFYLKVNGTGSDRIEMKIFDITGKLVEQNDNLVYGQETVAGTNLESGIYLVQVKQGDDNKVIRIVKAE